MENRENKLNFLSELIKAKRMGDFTEFGVIDSTNPDPYLESLVLEFKEALSAYHNSLDVIADKLIHHLSELDDEARP